VSAAQEGKAIRILDGHRLMAISTVRPDGWPQTTIVGYSNIGLIIYFMIFRASQKFANIAKDNRVSIAVSPEPRNLTELQAVYAGATAAEVFDPAERDQAWKLLVERHPNLADYELPPMDAAALMRANCKYLAVLDYASSWGEAEHFTVGKEDAA
jgi:nitroimidazol reductase NimA-like FMN-containing flavoprotein (pyridoxamine 5'-phosphate oxidase superfamily)